MNWRLLGITVALIVICVPTLYLWYKHQLGNTSQALLQRAELYEQEKEWSKATNYYQRYLLLAPEDSETWIRMVEVYANGKPTPQRITRLVRLLYQALGRAPERTDLRMMLAENLLELGDFNEAEFQAKKLLDLQSSESPEAKKVMALSMFAQARAGDSEAIGSAIQALEEAAKELPGDVKLVNVAATALREFSHLATLQDRDATAVADQIMDRLVDKDPNNPDALIVRYRYRDRYKLSNDVQDLQTALKLSPENIDGLLVSADAALSEEDQFPQAEEFLNRAITAAPDDPRAYLALAKVMGRSNKSREALDLLRQAYRRMENQFDLGMAFADSLITANEFEEAQNLLGRIESKSQDVRLRLQRSARTQMENQLSLLRAKLAFKQGRLSEAVADLRTLLKTVEASSEGKRSREWLQATGMLAQIAEAREEWDLAARYWGDLANAVPDNSEIVLSAAAASFKAGDLFDSVRKLERFSNHVQPTPQMRVQIVQSHLAIQLSRPIENRNWTEFIDELDQAKQHVTNRWELVLAEIEYLLALDNPDEQIESEPTEGSVTEQHRRLAYEIVKAAEDSFSNQAAFWRAATLVYQRLGQETDVARSLARYHEMETSPVKRALLQVVLLSNHGKFDEAEQLLVALLPSLSGDDLRQVQQLQIETLLASNKQPDAHKLVAKLIAAHPNDAKMLTLGISISLDVGDLQSAEKWETALGQLEEGKLEWQYLRSYRLLSTYDTLNLERKNELEKLVALLRNERPRWHPVLALAGRHAQLKGDSLQAIADYRSAVELGDRTTRTLEQLVLLLYKADQLAEAEQYLVHLRSDQGSTPIFDALAIDLAVRGNRIYEALKLAKEGVELNPDDAMRYIWLANLLFQDEQAEAAAKVFRQAARRFPTNSQVWRGLLALFVKSGRVEDARKTIDALLASNLLPVGPRHFVAAQGFETLGDQEKAKLHYELSVKSEPKNIVARIGYANLLLTSAPSIAKPQYEAVLALAPENGQARRGLAILLASTGREEDWKQVLALLESESSESDEANLISLNNDRLRALLLSRQGRNRQERLANSRVAREMLQQIIDTQGDASRDLNRRALARVCEEAAILAKDQSTLLAAREQLRFLVDKDNPLSQDLITYIGFLLRHADFESTVPDTEATTPTKASEKSELREIFLADAESRLEDLKRVQEASSSVLTDALSLSDLSVRLWQARGLDEEAAKHVADLMKNQEAEGLPQSAKTQLLLTVGNLYSTLGLHAKAEESYRQLMSISPRAYFLVVRSLVGQGKRQEAADFCLSISKGEPSAEQAIVLAQLLTSSSEPLDQLPEARAAVEAALSSHNDNVQLLQAAAIMKASRSEYDGAISLFRRLIEIDPQNALALNNLATLLAERPNQLAEALECIQRAMSVVGRQAALLDTEGTIFLKTGEYNQAISCLEEAIAGGTSDARYFFHLAAAYQHADRNKDALNALQSARTLGLENSMLTDNDRDLLTQLNQELGQKASVSVGEN